MEASEQVDDARSAIYLTLRGKLCWASGAVMAELRSAGQPNHPSPRKARGLGTPAGAAVPTRALGRG